MYNLEITNRACTNINNVREPLNWKNSRNLKEETENIFNKLISDKTDCNHISREDRKSTIKVPNRKSRKVKIGYVYEPTFQRLFVIKKPWTKTTKILIKKKDC